MQLPFPLLEHLDLRYGLLWAFPPCLTNFRNLTQLRLYFQENGPKIEVPESISALSYLQKLELSSKGSISLPDSFSKLTTLEELKIAAQTDKEDIAPLQHLTGLIKLEHTKFCFQNASDGYPDFLCTFTLLKELGLWKSDVDLLPDALGNLKNLELLHLVILPYLGELPESIGALSALTKLYIHGCPRVESLPESIGRLAALKVLRLNGCNGLESLLESFGNLVAMETLSLDGCNGLESLPESIENLAALKN